MHETLARGTLIRRGAALALGGASLTALAGTAEAAPSRRGDIEPLRLALTLQEIQAGLYAAALRAGGLRAELREFARVAEQHERVHVATLRALLGSAAGDAPGLNLAAALGDDAGFTDAAIHLESLSVLAHTGRVAHLTPSARAQTARIASVDARHAAWLRALAGVTPARHVADEGRSSREISAALARLGLVARP